MDVRKKKKKLASEKVPLEEVVSSKALEEELKRYNELIEGTQTKIHDLNSEALEKMGCTIESIPDHKVVTFLNNKIKILKKEGDKILRDRLNFHEEVLLMPLNAVEAFKKMERMIHGSLSIKHELKQALENLAKAENILASMQDAATDSKKERKEKKKTRNQIVASSHTTIIPPGSTNEDAAKIHVNNSRRAAYNKLKEWNDKLESLYTEISKGINSLPDINRFLDNEERAWKERNQETITKKISVSSLFSSSDNGGGVMNEDKIESKKIEHTSNKIRKK